MNLDIVVFSGRFMSNSLRWAFLSMPSFCRACVSRISMMALKARLGRFTYVKRSAESLLCFLAKNLLTFSDPEMWNGMSQDHVDAGSHEIAADGHRLFAHPFGRHAHRGISERSSPRPPSSDDFRGRFEYPGIVHAASHVQNRRHAHGLAHFAQARPGQLSAASGVSIPSFAEAIAAQPVLSTRTSFSMSFFGSVLMYSSTLVLGLLHPTIPTIPFMRP